MGCISGFKFEYRWSIMVLFMRYLYQALWLDLRGVYTDRVRFVVWGKDMSVYGVVVCLRVCYGWGFFGFDIGDFWDFLLSYK